jgi:hypothetical protein
MSTGVETDSEIRPFHVDVPEEDLVDLPSSTRPIGRPAGAETSRTGRESR